jgi:gamma-glutamyltranspeptidase/glutathione hydrolase
MYVESNGEVMKGNTSSTRGWRASGVPGTVAGFALALEKYGSGKLSWAEVCEPSRRLAAEGHVHFAEHRGHAAAQRGAVG